MLITEKIMQRIKLAKYLGCALIISNFSLLYAGTISPKDATILASINSKIDKQLPKKELNLEITSHDSIVTLGGQVATDSEIYKLIEIAESVPGVIDVETKHLSTSGSKPVLKDAVITAKVKGTFQREKVFDDNKNSIIKIHTMNGVVYLSGHVNDKASVVKAVKLAMTIKEAKRIDSTIKYSYAS